MLGLGHGVQADTVSLAEIFSNKYSLAFNGTDECVTINQVGDDMTPENKGTISIWAIMNVTTPSQNIIRAQADSDNQIFIFWHNSSDTIRFNLKSRGTVASVQYDASSFDHSAWTHFAMTWENGGNIHAYINGSEVGEGAAYPDEAFEGSIDTVYLGQNAANGAYFKGQMDEVSIWTEVMSISELYNARTHRDVEFSGLDNSKLIAYYQFEEGTGTTTVDESGTGNTGTLVNTPTWTAY